MDQLELTFIRRPESIEAFLGTTWARRFSADTPDPVEGRYLTCYPPDDPQHRFDGIAVKMIARKREAQTIQSSRGSARRLGELRQERKGVLIVSERWALVRPNQDLARQIRNTPPQPPGIHTGAVGKLAPGTNRARMWRPTGSTVAPANQRPLKGAPGNPRRACARCTERSGSSPRHLHHDD
jgi:hypothetical protein